MDLGKPSESLVAVEEPCRRSHAGDWQNVAVKKDGCHRRWRNLFGADGEESLPSALEIAVEDEARRISDGLSVCLNDHNHGPSSPGVKQGGFFGWTPHTIWISGLNFRLVA